MVPIRIVFLCTLLLVLLYLHDSEAWRRRSFRVRIRTPRIRVPRIRVRSIVPRIRTRTPRIRIRTPRIRIGLRRVLDNVGDSLRDVRDSVRDAADDVKDKLKEVVACRRLSGGRLVNRCSGGDDHSSDSDEPDEIIDDIEETFTTVPEVDYCRNITLPEAWGAPSLTARDQLVLPIKFIALYMGETDCLSDNCDVLARALHSEEENYNFLIDGHGKIYKGRGWNSYSNHHIRDTNRRTEFGVVLIMTGEPVFEEAFNELVSCGLQLGTLDSSFNSTTDLKFRF